MNWDAKPAAGCPDQQKQGAAVSRRPGLQNRPRPTRLDGQPASAELVDFVGQSFNTPALLGR
jgi:hypothetical protein